jgi:peroxiredoxin Q/BCP
VTEARLEPGIVAPNFTLVNQDEQAIALKDLRGQRVILFFFPAAMTPGCTTQACDFRDSIPSLERAGYTVLGISRDTPEKLRNFRERDNLTYPLLSDPDHKVHSTYGTWGEKMNYGKIIEGVIRSTFVLDERGVIQHALYNVRATGHVGRLRTLLAIDT